MEQKSTAVKTLTNGIAHLFKQNKVQYSLWLSIYFISKVFFSVGIRFWANNSHLYLLLNHFLFSLQVTRVDGHGSISGPNEVRKVFLFFFCNQGCILAEPSGPWCLTFALGWLENLRFSIQIMCWAPWILQVHCTGLPSISLELSLANANLNWFFSHST